MCVSLPLGCAFETRGSTPWPPFREELAWLAMLCHGLCAPVPRLRGGQFSGSQLSGICRLVGRRNSIHSVYVCVCVCGVTECPVTNLFLRQQGVPGAEQGWHQRRPLLLPVISISDARLTYLQRLCKVLLARCFPRCVCFMLNLVTFSPLEGNLVPCEPRLIILETFRLYSRLISCTRKISILHLEFKCVHPIRGESSGVPIV